MRKNDQIIMNRTHKPILIQIQQHNGYLTKRTQNWSEALGPAPIATPFFPNALFYPEWLLSPIFHHLDLFRVRFCRFSLDTASERYLVMIRSAIELPPPGTFKFRFYPCHTHKQYIALPVPPAALQFSCFGLTQLLCQGALHKPKDF